MAKGDKQLTNAQLKFCYEYLIDWNATRAYKAAYNVKSDRTASAAGSRLLANVKIQAELKKMQEEIAKTAGVSILRNIEELKKIAYSDATRVRSGWMELKAFDELTDEDRACIQEIVSSKTTFGENGEKEMVKIKVYSKLDAMKMLNEMLGFNAPKKVDVTSDGEKISGFEYVKPSKKK